MRSLRSLRPFIPVALSPRVHGQERPTATAIGPAAKTGRTQSAARTQESRLERLAESSRPGDVCSRLLSALSLIIGLIERKERKERKELQNSMRSLRSLRPFIPVALSPRVHGQERPTATAIGPAAKTGRTQSAARTQESRLERLAESSRPGDVCSRLLSALSLIIGLIERKERKERKELQNSMCSLRSLRPFIPVALSPRVHGQERPTATAIGPAAKTGRTQSAARTQESRLERLAESSRPGDVCSRLLSASSLIIGLIERKERKELQNSMRSLRSLRPFIPVALSPRVHGQERPTATAIGPAAKTGRTQSAARTQESRLGRLAESSRPGDVCRRLLSASSLIIGLIERKERKELQNSMCSLRSLRPFIPVALSPRVHGQERPTATAIGPAAKTGRTQSAARTQESRLGKGTDTILRGNAFLPSERRRCGEKWSQCPGCVNSISRLAQRGQQRGWRRHRQTSC